MVLYAINLAKNLIKQVINPGDVVVDANGNDTVFLAGLVGDNGKVYGFEIQQKALDITRNILEKQGLIDRVNLICDGHQNMDQYINKPVKAVMFNLGYLPGGDHGVVTNFQTTLTAVEKSLKLLKCGGIITIAAYCGHSGGMEEKDMLMKFISDLNPSVYKCISVEALNQENNPPVLMVIEKM